MFWTTERLQNEQHIIEARRPSNYRAPSWSWLSIDSYIEFYSGEHGGIASFQVLFDFIGIEIEKVVRASLAQHEVDRLLVAVC